MLSSSSLAEEEEEEEEVRNDFAPTLRASLDEEWAARFACFLDLLEVPPALV
jgi:hypothetical protein